jgi:Tfp pilus assembly protein PilN
MRIGINLASEPFRRDRAMVAGSIAVASLLVISLVLLILLVLNERHQKGDLRAAIGQTEAELKKVDAEAAGLERMMRQPNNAEALERSLLLNTLISRKAISWQKIFADLEGVMPHSVRLITIRPQVNSRNEITLEMYVGAASGEPVVQFLERLEGSSVFSNSSVANWQAPSQTEPLFRYRVSVNYAQKL